MNLLSPHPLYSVRLWPTWRIKPLLRLAHYRSPRCNTAWEWFQTADSFRMFINVNIFMRLATNTWIFIGYLEQTSIPEGLSRQREELLHSSSLLPHHKLLSGRGEVQGGDNIRVVRQLGPDGLAVQLFHTVHNQLPFTLCLGLFHWRQEKKRHITWWLQY